MQLRFLRALWRWPWSVYGSNMSLQLVILCFAVMGASWSVGRTAVHYWWRMRLLDEGCEGPEVLVAFLIYGDYFVLAGFFQGSPLPRT